MILSCYLGVAGLSDVLVGFYDATETIIGSAAGTGVQAGASGYYSVSIAVPSNAASVRWTSAAASATAVEYFEVLPANLVQVAGQTASAAAPVAFPASIGTSTLTAGAQMDLVNAPNATAVTAIQSGLSKPGTAQTITPADTAAATAAQSTISTNLDAKISTRSTYAGGAVASVTAAVTVGTNNDKTGYSGTATNFVAAPTAASIRQEIDANSTKLDVAVSSRSTYAGADTSGTTTLLGRLTDARAGYLDTLNGLVANIWSFAARTLSAFGFSVPASNLPNDYARNNAAPTWYTAPDNADVQAGLADLVTLLARTDPTTALAAIKGVTDQFRFSVANKVDAGATVDTSGLTATLSTGQAQQLADAAQGAATIAAADSILLASPYVPTNAPSAIIPAQTDAGQITGFTTTRDAEGTIEGNVLMTFELIRVSGSGQSYRKRFQQRSSPTGAINAAFVRGARYRQWRGISAGTAPCAEFTAPMTGDNFALPAIIGTI